MNLPLLAYPDGTHIEVGDSVLFDAVRTAATVEFVVRTSEEMTEVGVREPGLLLRSAEGLVYLAQGLLAESPLKFVARAPRRRLDLGTDRA